MITAISTPPPLVLSGHPCWIKVRTDNSNTRSLLATIRNKGKTIGIEKSWVVDKTAVFEISEYLDGAIKPVVVASMPNRIAVNESLSELFEVTITDGFSNLDFLITAIKGKLPPDREREMLEKGYGSFLEYLQGEGPWLSLNKGDINVYDTTTPHRLYWVVLNSNWNLMYAHLKKLTTIEEVQIDEWLTITNPGFGKILEIDLSNHLSFTFIGDTLIYYQLHLDSPINSISNRFFVKKKPRNQKTFFFRNPVGGFDCLAFTGRILEEAETSSVIIQQEDTFNETSRWLQVSNETSLLTKVESGGLDSNQLDLVVQLAASPQVMLWENGLLTDITIQEATIPKADSDNRAHNVVLGYLPNLKGRVETGIGSSMVNAALLRSNPNCWNKNNGSLLFVNSVGGSKTYEYTINGSTWQASPLFENLRPGTYNPGIRDKQNPTNRRLLEAVVLVSPGQLKAELLLRHTTPNGTTGRITVINPTGGSGEYQYALGGFDVQDSPIFDNLTPGDYDFVLIDKNNPNCTSVQIAVDILGLQNLGPLTATVAFSNPTSFGLTNGSVSITNPAGGSGLGYQFSINNGGTWQTSGSFQNLSPGGYHIKMRDNASNEAFLGIVVLAQGPLATPTNFTVHQASACESPLLSWSPVPLATFYEYMRSFNEMEVLTRVFSTNVFDGAMALTNGFATYKVRAGNDQTFSEWTPEISLMLNCPQ